MKSDRLVINYEAFWFYILFISNQEEENVIYHLLETYLVAQTVKNPPANAGDVGSIPGSRRSPSEENDYPLQNSYLENSMDRGARWVAVHVLQIVWHDWATDMETSKDSILKLLFVQTTVWP